MLNKQSIKTRLTQNMKAKHISNAHTKQMSNAYHHYDWQATVVRWLFLPFSEDLLVLPVKKSDMCVKFKRQLNRTYHKHEINR